MSGYQLGRDARRGDAPYRRPRQPLGFAPSLRECEKCPPDGCDLSCSWPAEAEPLLWEGDDS